MGFGQARSTMTKASLIRQAACGDAHFRENCSVHQRAVLFSISYKTWDRRKCSLTVHRERRGSVVVSTSACHAGSPGSIPGPGT